MLCGRNSTAGSNPAFSAPQEPVAKAAGSCALSQILANREPAGLEPAQKFRGKAARIVEPWDLVLPAELPARTQPRCEGAAIHEMDFWRFDGQVIRTMS